MTRTTNSCIGVLALVDRHQVTLMRQKSSATRSVYLHSSRAAVRSRLCPSSVGCSARPVFTTVASPTAANRWADVQDTAVQWGIADLAENRRHHPRVRPL